MHLTHYVFAALSAGVASVRAANGPQPGPPMPMPPGPLGPPGPPGPHDLPLTPPGRPQRHKRPDGPDRPQSEDERGGNHLLKRGGRNDGCGYAKVVNKCSQDVFLWSVAWDTDGPYKIGCGEEYREKFEPGGVALEIVKDKTDWYDDCEKLIFYYKLAGHGDVYYDLYEKFGHPFEGDRVALLPEERSCPKQIWDNGCGTGGGDYDRKCCDDDEDLILYLCDDDGGRGRGGWSPPHHRYPPEDEYPPYYPPEDEYPPCFPEHEPPCYDDNGKLNLRRRSLEGVEEDDGAAKWHVRQWENDKPDWDTDNKCRDCGEREKGWVTNYVNTTEVEMAGLEPGGE